jgi:hypothetical protein
VGGEEESEKLAKNAKKRKTDVENGDGEFKTPAKKRGKKEPNAETSSKPAKHAKKSASKESDADEPLDQNPARNAVDLEQTEEAPQRAPPTTAEPYPNDPPTLPKKRGRKPKPKPEGAAQAANEIKVAKDNAGPGDTGDTEEGVLLKKGRGRPRKPKPDEPEEATTPKKGRGRPRKPAT